MAAERYRELQSISDNGRGARYSEFLFVHAARDAHFRVGPARRHWHQIAPSDVVAALVPSVLRSLRLVESIMVPAAAERRISAP